MKKSVNKKTINKKDLNTKNTEKNKVSKLNVISAIIVAIIVVFALIGAGFFYFIYINAPEFNTDLLYKQESSNIYDSKGVLITTIGSEKRQIVEYKELPQVLIDAIIATEDARFYEHNGIDLPRYMIASYGYFTGQNAGGASTITMQVSKNSFTSTEAEGIEGIVRKFTDIYLSVFKIERDYSKEEILEFYVNAPYLGGGSYGVQMASKTYFGKNVSQLNLVEAAMIAGMFQAPGEYDPYVNPDKTNERKNEVVNLMLRHNFITETEANAALKVDIEDHLEKLKTKTNKYQGFIDTVVQEVIDRTGNNPYEVSMDIYSTMVRKKQDVINNFYNKHKFKDKKIQVGIGVIDNKTGAIIAVGAGRNKKSEMSLNYATQIKRHPGSTAKPLFDYGPGIEYKNWSTYTPFMDEPVRYTNGGIMQNYDYRYRGFLTLKECLVDSRNTCALQAFQAVSNHKINAFVTSLGITPEYLGNNKYIHEAHSIGAFTGVSPVQLAASYQAFGNGGYYTEPHSVTKVVYKNGAEEIEEKFNFEKKRVMKATTAYMISYILQGVTPPKVKVKGTQIATKTGTSTYDEARLRKLGLGREVIQDAWTVTFTKDYSVAIWLGYDKLTRSTYITNNRAREERKKIQAEINNKIHEKNTKFTRPSGLVFAQVVFGTNPPKLPSSSTPRSRIQTHLFIKGTQPTQRVKEVVVKETKKENEDSEE